MREAVQMGGRERAERGGGRDKDGYSKKVRKRKGRG